MLADFCLRLAAGMAGCMLLLSPAATARPRPGTRPFAHPNFFRTHCLTVLALAFGALLWVWSGASGWLLVCLGAAAVCACLASVTWSLERSPGAVTLLVLLTLILSVSLGLLEQANDESGTAWLVGAFSSAALLGAALSAMLLGHAYLIAPGMTMAPLYRLLAALAVALLVRATVDGVALGQWSSAHDGWSDMPADAMLWLPVRWLVGLVGPAVLCWMAWRTALIRSTQSATGILYVVVIFCFLGELTGRLLREHGVTF